VLISASILLSGCPKANSEYDVGRKAEATQDYDTALQHYQKALAAQPNDMEFKVRVMHVRFEAAQMHVEQGQRALHTGDLQLALAEFQKAQSIDPSSAVAEQQIRKVSGMLGQQKAPETKALNPNPEDDSDLLSGPPVLKPLSNDRISYRATNDSRQVFETIAKLAGLSVIFDPEFQSKRITADLPNVTLEEALDAISFESKSFWKPLTPNIILVAPDQPQKRKDLEDEEVRTFYMNNTLTPQDLTEVVTGLRQLLNLTRVQQVNSQNAIVIRDTPDKLMLASKIIRDIDKAKPEVLLHVQVLQVSLDKLRDIGILPGQSVAAVFDPSTAVQPQNQTTSSTSSTSTTTTTTTSTTSTSSSSTSSGNTLISLNNLKNLSSADYSLTLPGAALNAIMTDTRTRIIQDPEVRVSDGEQAKLRIGNKVPVATGSFQAGVGVSATTSGVVNPLVNTQFTYLDVGVNIDATPRIHPGGEVSMKLKVEVSSVTGTSTIGGISQPIISQRTVEHDIRLKEGEVNVLGGLIERDESIVNNGWPGLGQIPFIKYLFSDNRKEFTDSEVLIVLTPHILRLPSITAENLRPIAAGSDTNVRVYRTAAAEQPITATPGAGVTPAPAATVAPTPGAAMTATAPPPAAGSGHLHFEPTSVTIKPGETSTIAIAIDNAHDLFSIPLMIQYNPAVIQIDEARNGGFLSGGTQEIAVVQRVDQQKGQAIISATRQPNTPGVDGNGTVLGLIIHGVAPGNSLLQIVQVNARDSQQKAIPLTGGEATVKVQ
jgi:general secretion pathway protein D